MALPAAEPGTRQPGNRPDAWTAELAGMRHAGVFPGVELAYLHRPDRLEVALVIDPGVDPSTIALAFPGVESVGLDGDGTLVLTSGMLQSRLTRPDVGDALTPESTTLSAGWMRRGADEIGLWTEGARDPAAPLLVHFEATLGEVVTETGPVAQIVTLGAPMDDALVADGDGDGAADAGDTIRYTTTITNSGDEAAQDMQLDATLDVNTALVAGSLNISPLAIDDAYTDAIGHVTFNVDAGSGILANDRDPPAGSCATCTITDFDAMSVNGGTVTVNADGSFTYDPPVGFTGDDTFTYTVQDAHGTTPLTNSGTVTISVADLVWFVDSSAAAGGDGRQATPFQTLAEAETASATGHTIRVRQGTSGTTPYAGGITLKAQQTLVGGGVDLVIGATTVEVADAGPAIITNAGGDVITLAADNTVEGVTLQPVASAGVFGTGALGAAVVNGVAIEIGGATSDAIFLQNSSGSFTFSGGTVSTTTAGTGVGVRIDGGTPTVSVDSSTVSKTGGRVLDVLNTTGGTVTFSGGSLISSNGSGLRVSNAAGDVSVDASTELNILNAAATPITVTGSSPGSNTAALTIGRGSVDSNNGPFPLIAGTNSSAALTLNNVMLTHGGGRILAFDDMDGGADFAGTIVTTNTHDGLSIIDSAGTFSNIFDLSVLNPIVDALVLQNNTGTYSFGLLDITTNGPGIRGIFASNAGMVNVANTASQVTSSGGPAIDIDTSTLGMTFASVTSSSSFGAGIDLDTVAGSFIASGGAIGSAAGAAVDVNAGSATITYAGGITNTAGRSVEVTGRAGGAITLSGMIDDTGTGILVSGNSAGSTSFTGTSTAIDTGTSAAVTLTSNTGHAINFSGGGLDIDTTSGAGFAATGGGSLVVSGAGNSVTSTTGTAVNIASTTIAAGGVTFASVSSNGATNGIVLDGTGSAGLFSVTGDGTTGTGITANNDSGGSILNATGDGIVLTNVDGVSLDQMRVQNAADNGINGSGVANLTLARANLVGNGTANEEHGLMLLNPGGTITVANTLGDSNFDAHFRVFSQTGNDLTLFSVNDSVLQNVTTGFFEDGISFEAQTGVNTAISVTNSTFSNHDGDHVQASSNGSANMGVTITGNTMTGMAGNLGAGITVNSAGTFSGTTTFDVSSNNIQKANDNSTSININIGSSTAAGTYTGTVTGNTIGSGLVADSAGDTGISVEVNQNATMNVVVSDNIIDSFDNIGIDAGAVDGTGTLNVTITGNTATSTDSNVFSAVFVDAQTTNSVCADIGGATLENTMSASAGLTDVAFLTGGSGVINLESYVGPASDEPQIQTYIQGRNTGTPGVRLNVSGGPVQGGSACPTG